MSEPKKKKRKKPHYKSPETRARQLAGLAGVRPEDHVPGIVLPKVNGQGLLASVSEADKKAIIEMYCNGMSLRAIEAKTGYSRQTIDDVKRSHMDMDSGFRDAMFRSSLKEKLQTVVEGVADAITEKIPDMSGKDLALTLGITFDKLQALDNNKGGVEQLHQHVHVHAQADIAQQMIQAMNPKK